MKIGLVFGTRPQVIKLSPLIKTMKREKMDFFLVNTGQHYDYELDKIFFKELDIKIPEYNLNVGSSDLNSQLIKTITRLEKILMKENPDVCLTIGDTNSTLAASLCVKNMGICLIHIEGGLRSRNKEMPEERIRILADHLADYVFTPTKTATRNLLSEHIPKKRIIQTGDLNLVVFRNEIKKVRKNTGILKKIKIGNNQPYFLLTLHRTENVDNKKRLKKILDFISNIEETIIFPIHPRTKKRLKEFAMEKYIKKPNIIITKPVGYLDLLCLIKKSDMVLTDSGGVQRETFFLKKPCIILRSETEWIETLKYNSFLFEKVKNYRRLKIKKNYTPENIFGRDPTGSMIRFLKSMGERSNDQVSYG
ncbi:UDP-N-acetylglucosamine 2-epimerase (non-hydrolyzing) [bacterium]|nr:UDP-N-acetylglucosamine 2-epimerase (non-hydrolyzing) [bacterium]